MTAQELRIGNYVKYKNKTIIVDTIYYDSINMDITDCDGIEINLLQPIPLTEEWLLKLGFERKSGSEFEKSRFTYRFQQRDLIIEGFEYDYNGIICHPEYVHQLQNLFHALTGEELICNHD